MSKMNQKEFEPVPTIGDEFQRRLDEVFDEMLIGPWRTPAWESEPAMVLEREGAYEVRLCTGAFKPSELDLVVNENRLMVRARRGASTFWERLVTFADPVETEKVTAKWANRILTVLLPRQPKTPPKQPRPRSERK